MKRTTRTKLVRGALYLLFVAGVVTLALVADWAAFADSFLDLEVARAMFPEVITTAVRNTALYTVLAFAGGLVVGLVLALMKMSPVAPYRWIATGYIELFRGLPAIVVIIVFAFAVPIAFGWRPPGGPVGAGIIALVIVASAYIAETLRAGIQAVPKGQIEAARSLGMSGGRSMISIVLPQAFRIVVPPLTNEFVILIKDTSLLFVAGIALNERELTQFARDGLTEFASPTPLTVAALLYLAITLPLTRLVARLERRQQRAR